MANFKTVYDLMGSASHGRSFRGKDIAGDALDELEQYDGELDEFKSIGLVERNILSGANLPDEFTLKEGSRSIKVGVTCVAKALANCGGMMDLAHTKDITLEPFRTHGDWRLEYEHGSTHYPDHAGVASDRDTGVMGSISAQFTHLGENEVGGLQRTLIAEIISQKQDMCHVFMKGYLMLMDLNLSVIFRCDNRRFGPKVDNYRPNLNTRTKLGLIVAKDIVVDSEGFSADELLLLDNMCQAYPRTKYSPDNVYNTCSMSEDSLAIISSGEIHRSTKEVPTPGEMYRNMVNLACKLKCTGDMTRAFKMMRGRASHIRDVNAIVEDRMYHCEVSRSNSYVRCLGGSTRHGVMCSNYPSYFSTSVGLVADLLLGSSYEVAASMLVEHLGGLGNLMCEDGPFLSESYNSMMRDYGLSSKDGDMNELMLAWEGLSNISYRWSPLYTWKPYFERLTHRLRLGQEVLVPQMSFEIAHMYQSNNTWGAIRGFNGIKGSGLAGMSDIGSPAKRAKDDKNRLAAAFTFGMGIRNRRPLLYHNAYGSKEVSVSTAERCFLAATVGGYRISHVSYTLSDDYEGREDWTEETATALIKSTISGTRCSIIVSTAGEWSYSEYKASDEEIKDIVQSVVPRVDKPDEHVDDEIVKMVTSERGTMDIVSKPVRTIDDIFKDLRGIYRPKKVKLSGSSKEEIGDKVMIKRLQVPGDGKCGIHAIVASLRHEGMIRDGEDKMVFSNFDNKMREETFHAEQSIAAAVNGLGIGLRAYDRLPDGTFRLTTYGDVSDNGVSIMREGMHFSGVAEGDGTEITISSREGGVFTNEEQVAVMAEMGKFFES